MNIYLYRVVKAHLLVKGLCGTLAHMNPSPVPGSCMPQKAAISAPRRVPTRKRPSGHLVCRLLLGKKILSAAAQLFAEHGFASTSMPAIAALSGITAGAIYRHFASQAEPLVEVVE